MNTQVARIIREQIESLPFMDKVGGLVKVVTKQEQSNNGFTTKTFPVDCNVTSADCISGKYDDLIPNSKYKSIHYFEDLGVSISGQDQAFFDFVGKVKLVGWLNLKKLGKTDCNVSHLAQAAILKTIQAKNFNDSTSGFTRIQIRCDGIEPKTANIFSKYSYPESVTQYLMFPFDYYAMTFTVSFRVPYKCIDDWLVSTETNCVDNGA